MNSSNKYNGTRHFIYAEWPLFAGLYGGVVFALLIIGVSVLAYIALWIFMPLEDG